MFFYSGRKHIWILTYLIYSILAPVTVTESHLFQRTSVEYNNDELKQCHLKVHLEAFSLFWKLCLYYTVSEYKEFGQLNLNQLVNNPFKQFDFSQALMI